MLIVGWFKSFLQWLVGGRTRRYPNLSEKDEAEWIAVINKQVDALEREAVEKGISWSELIEQRKTEAYNKGLEFEKEAAEKGLSLEELFEQKRKLRREKT